MPSRGAQKEVTDAEDIVESAPSPKSQEVSASVFKEDSLKPSF